MLEVKEINQFYGGSHILRDVSFQAPVGECSVILGRNGVGKTTLLKCLMGILPIKSGQILLDGKDIAKMSPEQRVRAGLVYVPQGRDIFSTLTVEENILIGMAKFSGAKTRKVPSHLYEIFPVLDEKNKLLGLILLDEIRPIVFSQFKVKYTSTNEVMQPPKEIIFYDETLETIMEKFDASECKVLPVLKNGIFLGFMYKQLILEKYRHRLKSMIIE